MSTSTIPITTTPKSFTDLHVVSRLGQSRYQVFQVYSKSAAANFALKLFPYQNDRIDPCYEKESRLTSLSHQNLISFIESRPVKETITGSKHYKTSYILMELAPYGDFADLLIQSKLPRDEKLARTYFHQLVSGVEYMHSENIAHMDLKLENLLMSENFELKIADFDSAFFPKDHFVSTRGTINFRAPEVKAIKCRNPKKADIYSMGIILFALKAGLLPYIEEVLVKGYNLFELLKAGDSTYWNVMAELNNPDLRFDDDFKELFMSMVKADPEKRASIEDIKKSRWYQGPIYTNKELVELLEDKLESTIKK